MGCIRDILGGLLPSLFTSRLFVVRSKVENLTSGVGLRVHC